MFFHLYYYRLKTLCKQKDVVLWALLFPFILGTLFFVTFGSNIGESVSFKSIPIAVTVEGSFAEDEAEKAVSEQNEALYQVLEAMQDSGEGDGEPLFEIRYEEYSKAEQMLKDREIAGIISVGESLKGIVAESGIKQSILTSFLDEYLATEYTMKNIVTEHPEKANEAALNLQNSVSYIRESSLAGNNLDTNSQYFYALVAMTCLNGFAIGVVAGGQLLKSLPIGARRCIMPANKLLLVLSDLAACLTLHLATLSAVLAYLILVVHVNFGDQPLSLALICITGSVFGVSLGSFMAGAIKNSDKASTITLAITMVWNFLAGLMIVNMKDIVEKYIPFLNKINPAALMSDAMYCMSVYDDTARLHMNLLIMCGFAAVFLTGNVFMMMRRS